MSDVTNDVDAVEKSVRVLFAAVRGVLVGAYRALKALGKTFVETMIAEVKSEIDNF
jgi:hypothetical protein